MRKKPTVPMAALAAALGLCIAISIPTTSGALTRAASPAPYLLTRSDMPQGWTKLSLSGTGIPGLLSEICPSKDRRAGVCVSAGAGYKATAGVPSLIEGLVNFSGTGVAQSEWNEFTGLTGYSRVTLGHFGTASRAWLDKTKDITVYLTLIRKGRTVAVVEYVDVSNPRIALDASYWDAEANAVIPPKSKAATPTTTTTASSTTTTTTRLPTSTSAPSTTVLSTTCSGPCKFTFASPDLHGFSSVQLNSLTQAVPCPALASAMLPLPNRWTT